MNKDSRFGINMKDFCRRHEAWLETNPGREDLLKIHLEKLRWLQHERFVHLIVTVMVVICELFLVGLVLLYPELGIIPALLMLGAAILLGFYFRHYFFLENTVQKWYLIAERLMEEKSEIDNNDKEKGRRCES